jgi:hypothetical protein
MAITYSTNLKLTLIGTGDQAGTWGNTTNTNLGTLIEQAIAGYVSQTVADSAGSPTSLSIADGTSSVARNMVLVLQGALSAARDIILPTSTKLYFIHNNTSGGFAVTAKCSGQTGVSIPNGAKVILACNGTDIVEAFNYSGSLIFPTSATITTLSGTTLGYGSASITNASIASGTVTNLLATNFSGGSASITTVTGTTFGTTGASQIRGASGAIGQLTVTSATITNLNVTSLTTGNFPLPTSATIATLSGTTLSYASASLTNVSIGSGTVSGNFNAATASGNVGIGTASPSTYSAKLVTAGAFGSSTPAVSLVNTSAENAGNIAETQYWLANSFSGLVNVAKIGAVTGTTGNQYGSLYFSTSNAGAPAERMRIDSAGNVGIGTTSPWEKLSIPFNSALAFGNATYSYKISRSGSGELITTFADTYDASTARVDFVMRNGAPAQNTALSILGTGNVGIGTTSPASKLDVNGSANINGGLTIAGNLLAPSDATVYTATGDLYVRSGSSGALRFGSNGSNDRMLLDSAGNVGIGTTSPVGRLTLRGAAGTSGKNQGILLEYSNGTEYGALGLNNGSGWPQLMARAGAGMTFHVNSDLLTTGEAMRLDSSGNLGLGVTPSAWGAGKAIEVGFVGNSLYGNSSNNMNVVAGAYFNSGFKYAVSSLAVSYYNQSNGAHAWLTAPSGTAGNAISFTQAMTLDASGNLSIGTSSPAGKLDIVTGTNRGYFDDSAGSLFRLNAVNAANSAYAPLSLNGSVLTFQTGASERMRIDSAGNVGIGTTSVGQKLLVRQDQNDSTRIAVSNQDSGSSADSGIRLGSFGGSWDIANGSSAKNTNALTFGQVGGSERMRIDSAGNVGIGTTSPSSLLQLNKASGAADMRFSVGGTLHAQTYASSSDYSMYAVSEIPMIFGTNNIERMRINSAGNVGIGTSSPASKLEVKGTGFVASSISGDSTSETQLRFLTNTGARVSQQANQALIFDTNATERVRITSAGDVGIGVVSPTVKLDVAGSILASGNVTAYSDIRVKDNVESIEGAIGKLNQIRGVTYTRTDLDDKQRRFAGVIAQEIEQVLPEAVFDNGKVKAVDYNATIALLIEAVKEQQGQINELKLTIEQLKGK